MRRKTYVLLKRRLLQALVVGLILGAGYVYFRTGAFTLKDYVITGAPDEYVDQLQAGLHELSEQKLLWILPGNRSLSYHDDDIRTLITDTLPNTKSISIHPTGLHTLSIKLTSYQPVFSISERQAIASDATIYTEINSMSNLPRMTVASTTVVTSRTLSKISQFIQNINAVMFEVKYVNIDEYDDVRLYNDTHVSNIITSTNADMDKTWSNVLSAIDTEPLKSKLADKNEHLLYLDTRFGNKVFYKFTNGSEAAIIPPHASSTAISAESTTTVR